MKKIAQWIKRVGLFLFGVALVVWGYKVNAANNIKAKEEKKAQEKESTPPASIFGSIKLNDDTEKNNKQETISDNKTVIESDETVEESSGTE